MVSDKGFICLLLVPTIFRYRTLVGSKIDASVAKYTGTRVL